VTVLGYLWLNHFSDLNYDHRLGALSAAASAIAFPGPCTVHHIPDPAKMGDYAPGFDRILVFIMAFGAATIAVGSLYGFRVSRSRTF